MAPKGSVEADCAGAAPNGEAAGGAPKLGAGAVGADAALEACVTAVPNTDAELCAKNDADDAPPGCPNAGAGALAPNVGAEGVLKRDALLADPGRLGAEDAKGLDPE